MVGGPSRPPLWGALAVPLARRKRRAFFLVCGGFYNPPPGGFPARGCGAFGPLPGPLRCGPLARCALAPGFPAARRSGPGAPPGPRAAARWGPPGRCVAAAARSPRALGPSARCPLPAGRPCTAGRPLAAPPVPWPRGGPPRAPLPRPAPSGRLRCACPRSSRPGRWRRGRAKGARPIAALAARRPGRGGLGLRVGGLFRLRRLLFKTSLELFGSPSRPFNPGAAHSLAKQGQGCGSCDPLRSRIAKSGAWAFARAPLHSNSDPYSAFPYFRLYSSYDMA